MFSNRAVASQFDDATLSAHFVLEDRLASLTRSSPIPFTTPSAVARRSFESMPSLFEYENENQL
jgi:hypothetical protein